MPWGYKLKSREGCLRSEDYYRFNIPAERPACSTASNKIIDILLKLKKSYSIFTPLLTLFNFLTLIEGRDKNGNRALKLCYIGHGENFHFIVNKLYSEYEIKQKHHIFNPLLINRLISAYENKVDLLVIDIKPIYHYQFAKQRFVKIPRFVGSLREIPKNRKELFQLRRNASKTIRKILNSNLSYYIVNRREDINVFFEDIYLKYLYKRFGEETSTINKRQFHLLTYISKLSLLQIMNGSEVVSGLIFYQSNKCLHGLFVGANIKNGILPHHCAFDALYFFSTIHAYNLGCEMINFGGSYPLLNNGLVKFKRKWGGTISERPTQNNFLLIKFMRFTPAIESFFEGNYFITIKDKKLTGIILVTDHVITSEELETLSQTEYTRNLSALMVFSMNGFEEKLDCRKISENIPIEIIDLKNSSDQLNDFLTRLI